MPSIHTLPSRTKAPWPETLFVSLTALCLVLEWCLAYKSWCNKQVLLDKWNPPVLPAIALFEGLFSPTDLLPLVRPPKPWHPAEHLGWIWGRDRVGLWEKMLNLQRVKFTLPLNCVSLNLFICYRVDNNYPLPTHTLQLLIEECTRFKLQSLPMWRLQNCDLFLSFFFFSSSHEGKGPGLCPLVLLGLGSPVAALGTWLSL